MSYQIQHCSWGSQSWIKSRRIEVQKYATWINIIICNRLVIHYFCVLWWQVEHQQSFKKGKGVRGGVQGGTGGRERKGRKQEVSSGYDVSSHDHGISASWIMLQSNGWCYSKVQPWEFWPIHPVALADSRDEGAFAGQIVLMCKILFKLKGVEANNIIIAVDGSAKTKPGSWRTARVIVKLSLW